MSATVQIGAVWTPGMMSSIRQDWATPRVLFAMLDKEFHFGLDACATAETATCVEYLTEDSLLRPWIAPPGQAIYVNPPYGRGVGNWIEKAFRESRLTGSTVVMLLPARTDTSWFHSYCLRGEIRFLRGRLNFDDKRSPRGGRCPFPSMLVIFR